MIPSPQPIVIPDAPAIPGLRFRHYHGPDDLPAMVAVYAALADAGQLEFEVSVEWLANYFDHEVNLDPYTDIALAEIDGQVVGLSRCYWAEEVAGPRQYQFNALVVPAWQGQGISRALLHWAEDHLRHTAATHPPEPPKLLQFWLSHGLAHLKPLLESEGYAPARYSNNMVRPSLDDIPDFPLPPGLEVRPARPEHYRRIWDAQIEAFQDHWGFLQHPEEDYQMWLNDPIYFQPALWQVAWDVATDEVAGMVLTFIDAAENERWGRRRGYTEAISVRRPWRRRGLARALIAHSLRAQREAGMTESALSVDSENLTGATRVYEDCGFRTVTVDMLYRKPL